MNAGLPQVQGDGLCGREAEAGEHLSRAEHVRNGKDYAWHR